MKRLIQVTVMVLVLVFSFSVISAQGPRPIVVQLFDTDGVSHPNPWQDGEITFRAWIITRTDHFIDETSTGSLVAMDAHNTRFLIQFNVGNFIWTIDEIIRLEIAQEARGLVAFTQFILTEDVFELEPLRLREPPVDLFDSNELDDHHNFIYPVTTTASLMENYPDEDGIYRANDWGAEGKYWEIEFSTIGVDEDIFLLSYLRRQFAGQEPDNERGPKYFTTYYSIDGEEWVPYGNPNEENGAYWWALPDNQEWNQVYFALPEECLGHSTVYIRWVHLAEAGSVNQNGWGEIKDVVITPYRFLNFSVSVAGFGSTIPAVDIYSIFIGTILPITAVPNTEGWIFDRWEINDIFYNTPSVAVHIIANFVAVAHFIDPHTGLDEVTVDLLETKLHPNYPNPFNPQTSISFSLAEPGIVHLVIYNVQGQKIRTLLAEPVPKGDKIIIWDGKDDQGRTVHSGVYFYKLQTPKDSYVNKMLLLK